MNIIFLLGLLLSSTLFGDDNLFDDSSAIDVSKSAPSLGDDLVFDSFEEFSSLQIEGTSFVIAPERMFDLPHQVNAKNSLGIGTSTEYLSASTHFTVYPKANVAFKNLFMELGVPLRFRIYDSYKSGNSYSERKKGLHSPGEFITPRPQDFQSAWDLQRLLRRMEIRDPKHVYGVRLARDSALTFGQGILVRRLRGEGLTDHDHLLADAFVALPQARFDAFLAPILKINMLGINSRFAPLQQANVPSFIKDLNVDVAYAGDYLAPNQVRRDDDGDFLLDNERRLVKRSRGRAQGLSFTALSRTVPFYWLMLSPYVGFGNLFLTSLKRGDKEYSSYGAGIHLGNDFKVFFTEAPSHSVLVFRVETRFFSPRYMPAYFGETYFLDRTLFIEPFDQEQGINTKSQYVSRQRGNWRFGPLTELYYEYEKALGVGLSYENAWIMGTRTLLKPYRHLRLFTQLAPYERFKLGASFEATAIEEMKDIFDFNKSRGLISVKGQVKILPFLYLDSYVQNSFGVKDMYQKMDKWYSDLGEKRTVDFGVGVTFRKTF